MFLEQVSSWNLRDRHMAETLEALSAHLRRSGSRAKTVVWAHNSHVGDARVTEMGQRGELNIGQIARERYNRDAVLVGQTTNHGTVTAASDWDGPAERKSVRPGLSGSYEALFHTTDLNRFMLLWDDGHTATEDLRKPPP
jgi:erythromycin esterase-like protein